jgi:hypothetical protein
MIWRRALPGARTVTVFYDHPACIYPERKPQKGEKDSEEETKRGSNSTLKRLERLVRTNPAPPILLQITKESRLFALEKYTRLPIGTETDPGSYVYFDLTIDTLHFPKDYDVYNPNIRYAVTTHPLLFGGIMSLELRSSIRRIDFDSWSPWQGYLIPALCSFPGLMEVTVILHDFLVPWDINVAATLQTLENALKAWKVKNPNKEWDLTFKIKKESMHPLH